MFSYVARPRFCRPKTIQWEQKLAHLQNAIFDPSGKFLITAQDNGVGVYKVGHDSLMEVSGSPFGEVGMDRVMLTPLGRFVVAISGAAGKIFVFALDSSTGVLALAAGSPVSTSSPFALAVIQQ